VNVAELTRLVEYKPAPEPLLAIQGLANTFDLEKDEEYLSDPPALRSWLLTTGLAAESVEVSEDDRERLLEFRTLIRALIDANGEAGLDRRANAQLAELAATHPVPVTVGEDGRVGLDLTPAGSVEALIAQLLGVVSQAQVDDTWRRLKICPADTCRWAFFDASKNRRGHWCSMEVCGNREKNRTYRAKQTA
jgi:predicted RNA-binding Zn ribbon-like protein